MIKLSDFLFSYLHKVGFTHAFLISGGGIIHLVDSIGKSNIHYICNHNEQASAVAAEGYSRIRDGRGLCIVTTGPGSTNAITGLIGAWLDSIPTLFISGQIKQETIADYSKLRQLGDQEINIIDIVKPVTKYAVTVTKPEDILYHFEKALHISRSGRPGPVWINIPMDVQGAYITKSSLRRFNKKEITNNNLSRQQLKLAVQKVIKLLKNAQRPLVMIGNGVRLSNALKQALTLVEKLEVPVMTGFGSVDLISSENQNFAGRAGTIGQRAGNFALQNADVLLVIGSRLNIRMVGYNFKAFARSAYKIMVDIDKEEIKKKTLSIDMPIVCNAREFIEEMLCQLTRKNEISSLAVPEWRKRISEWRIKYPVVLSEYRQQKKYVNPYYFIEMLSKQLKSNDVISLSNATASICTYQAIKFPQGTRVLTNSGSAAMGYGLPAAIGAYYASAKNTRILCIEGDGSIQMNIQELQTIVHNSIPIKIFIYNNAGYVSIRLTQQGLFQGRLVASGESSGVSCPDFIKIGKAYGIKTVRVHTHIHLREKIRKVLQEKGPVICQLDVDPNMQFLPKSSSKQLSNGTFVSRPLEDMYPFLSEDELQKNMYIPLWQE